ncbi:MAG: hypothetical protein ACE5H1_12115, partial [Thermodesulfobacteriota bacterium]
TLGLISSSLKVQNEPSQFNSTSYIFNLDTLDNSTQGKPVLLKHGDFIIEDSEKIFDEFSISKSKILTLPGFSIPTGFLLDSINSFYYTSILGFYPLRSPPLFS